MKLLHEMVTTGYNRIHDRIRRVTVKDNNAYSVNRSALYILLRYLVSKNVHTAACDNEG